MAPLTPVDWPSWKRSAEDFFLRNSQCQVRDLTWGERLLVPGAKEAWAVVSHGGQAAVRAVGGQPCGRCGNWTAAWCEGCQQPELAAICATCDHEHLLCERCTQIGRLWRDCHQSHDDEAVEVSGFYDDQGQWVRLEPVLRIPLAEIPGDGLFDMEFLSSRIREHREQSGAKSQGDSGRAAR